MLQRWLFFTAFDDSLQSVEGSPIGRQPQLSGAAMFSAPSKPHSFLFRNNFHDSVLKDFVLLPPQQKRLRLKLKSLQRAIEVADRRAESLAYNFYLSAAARRCLESHVRLKQFRESLEQLVRGLQSFLKSLQKLESELKPFIHSTMTIETIQQALEQPWIGSLAQTVKETCATLEVCRADLIDCNGTLPEHMEEGVDFEAFKAVERIAAQWIGRRHQLGSFFHAFKRQIPKVGLARKLYHVVGSFLKQRRMGSKFKTKTCPEKTLSKGWVIADKET